MSALVKKSTAFLAFLLTFACLPGGVIQKGGRTDQLLFLPAASMTHGAPYRILCPAGAERAAQGFSSELRNLANYHGECDVTGTHSTFYLLHLVPVTEPLNPAFAIARAVDSLEGDTMIHIRAWHETHYYGILGAARVFNVRGTVVRFINSDSIISPDAGRKNSP